MKTPNLYLCLIKKKFFFILLVSKIKRNRNGSKCECENGQVLLESKNFDLLDLNNKNYLKRENLSLMIRK